MNKTKNSESLVVILYICSVVSSIAVTLYCFSLSLHYDLRETSLSHYLTTFTILIILCLFSFYAGRKLYIKGHDEFYTTSISIILSITIPVGIIELVAGRSIPPWPAIELHGVSPKTGSMAWGRIQSIDSRATANNSWGQRDNQRTINPPAGKTRIAFIGDSFLEESSITPVSLLVESSLPASLEVVNLGVSATDPVDYYWRLKNVALKLGVEHVFVFMFIGNDLLDDKPVDNRGITTYLYAPPPQDSLLGILTPAINYHMSKKYKQSTTVWLTNNLHTREQTTLKQISKIGLNKLAIMMEKNNRHRGGRECYKRLSKLDLGDFYHMLTNPDMGLFRTYTLDSAITNFCHPLRNIDDNSAIKTGSYSLRMITLMSELSEKNNIGFSVVLVPQGFDVDDRMWSQWKILTDYRKRYKHSLMASKFKQTLTKNDIHVIDLYTDFKSKRGTYLNIDGHWSTLGNELAAKKVTQEIIKLDIK